MLFYCCEWFAFLATVCLGNLKVPETAIYHRLMAAVRDQNSRAPGAAIMLLHPPPFVLLKFLRDAALHYSFENVQVWPQGDGRDTILCYCRWRLHRSFIHFSDPDPTQMVFHTVYRITAESFPISSAPWTASAFGALDSCPGGLRFDLFCSQRFLCMLQDLNSEQLGYSCRIFVFNKHSAGLF